MSRFTEALEHLLKTIDARKGGDPAASWTAKLLANPKLAAKKLGEEAVELVQASALKDKDAMAAEAADVLYHLLALLAAEGVEVEAVAAKLEARQGTSGIVEKAGRPN
jgi:phosphoribosyl-ATP pyrophosphohydrolase